MDVDCLSAGAQCSIHSAQFTKVNSNCGGHMQTVQTHQSLDQTEISRSYCCFYSPIYFRPIFNIPNATDYSAYAPSITPHASLTLIDYTTHNVCQSFPFCRCRYQAVGADPLPLLPRVVSSLGLPNYSLRCLMANFAM